MRVLLVEDKLDAAESMMPLLRFFGYEACVAFDGPSAIREATDSPPDVVLLDLGLPGIDWFEVARKIKNLNEAKQPIFVAVTGYGTEEDHRRSAESGIHFHFVKPVEPEVLKILLEGLNPPPDS